MYSLFDAKVKGIAYEGVADADLVHPGYLLVEEGQIFERKVVAGIEAKAAFAGNFGSLDKGFIAWSAGILPAIAALWYSDA